MNYIDEIFTRLDVQCVREFLLHGGESAEIDTRPYKERIETAQKAATSILHYKFPDKEEYEDISGYVLDYGTACENVYMEIGMQCGFVLAMQIMNNTKRPTDSEV